LVALQDRAADLGGVAQVAFVAPGGEAAQGGFPAAVGVLGTARNPSPVQVGPHQGPQAGVGGDGPSGRARGDRSRYDRRNRYDR
jgi:hypothetical protein